MNDALRTLYPQIVNTFDDKAFDADGNEVDYDKEAIKAKLAEMQAEETSKQEAQVTAKQSAMAKLAKLGLTEDEVKALIG